MSAPSSVIDRLFDIGQMAAAHERLEEADPIAADLARSVYDRLHERLRLTPDEADALARWLDWSRGAQNDPAVARNGLAKAALALGLTTPLSY